MLKKRWDAAAKWALDALFPATRCMACGAMRNIADGLCPDCEKEMERISGENCARCGLPLVGGGTCFHCKVRPPSFVYAREAYVYEGVVRQLVACMKFRGQYDLPSRRFGSAIAGMVRDAGWEVDAVTCVPTDARTLRRVRGYNQAEKLARRVALELSLPFYPRAMGRRPRHRSQVRLTAQQRKHNVEGSMFALPRMKKLKNKRVLLVDDVYTTGATLEETVRVLHEGGVQSVHVATAARSVVRQENARQIEKEKTNIV